SAALPAHVAGLVRGAAPEAGARARRVGRHRFLGRRERRSPSRLRVARRGPARRRVRAPRRPRDGAAGRASDRGDVVTRRFDLDTIPLEGSQVVEASAGTGKTRTITGLVLRLVVERGVPIDAILVVTYTVAATEELRDRVRGLLTAALVALRDGRCDDDMVATLVARAPDRAEAERRVRRALTDFDLAGILTIHGFCRRALVESAFESGLPFAAELVTDVTELGQDAGDDFWRRRVSPASPLFAQHLLDGRVTPDSLAAAIGGYLGRPDLHVAAAAVLPGDAACEDAGLETWRGLRAGGAGARGEVEVLLRDDGLQQNRYKPSSIPTWLRRMDAYLRTGLPGLRPFGQLEKLRASAVAKAWKKNRQPRTHEALDVVEAY